ncbi:MAG TPA: helix-turn-helix domain-containing protein [Chitinophagaceae bacterium]|nr:helix-turn-helix domain-containing protein [Chitinophagaceae bacterium]
MENPNELIEKRIPVPKEFEEVFSHFYLAENNTANPVARTLLPSYQTILVFNFGPKASLISKQNTKIEIDKCVVLGPIKYAFDYILPVGSRILVVNFKSDGFYRFFGTALLSDHLPIQPDELIDDNCFTNLWRLLNRMDPLTEKIAYILEFSKPYMGNRNATSELLINFKDDSLNSIKTIAQQTQQSERNIQLTHKKYLGYSAKEMNRYQRFLKAIELIQNISSNSAKVDWFEIIDQCGYYDQSQLIHDFRHFINLSPKTFLKFQQDICQSRAE